MKVGCPECGVLRDISEESLNKHNKRTHDGESVAKPIDEFGEGNMPDLKSIPTQHREKWRNEFSDIFGGETRKQVVTNTTKENEQTSMNSCHMCGGQLQSGGVGGTGVIECSECGHKERDTYVSGT